MTRSPFLGRPARLGAACLLAVFTSGCAYNSDMFDFVTWDGSEESEPVALSGSQLDQLRAQRDAQLEAMEDPSFRNVQLDLPNIDDYAAGQVEAMQRGVLALISDSAALSVLQGPAPTDIDAELDALIAAETTRRRAARQVATISPAPPERETYVIGQAPPPPPPVPAEALRSPAPTAQEQAESAERSSRIRQALVEREAQNAVRRELEREELAQQLQTEPAPGAGGPTVLPAAAAPALASLAPLSAQAGAEAPISPAARAPDTAAAAPSPTVGGAEPATQSGGGGFGGALQIATAPDSPPSAIPSNPTASAAAAPIPTPAAAPTGNTAAAAPTPAAPAPKPQGVPHTVASNDTLAAIAKKYGSTPAAIRSANGMNPRQGVYVGQELIVPQGVSRSGGGALPPSAADPLPKPIAPARNLTSPKLSQYRSDRAPQVTPPINGGEVITAYGAPLGAGGKLSTGVQIAAAPGAPVIAASDGKVAYLSPPRGSRGGELTLVHADGMITRYKGLGPINLRHGDRVRRGQQIAALPNTGDARLLFELLDGQDPIDPVPFFVAQVR